MWITKITKTPKYHTGNHLLLYTTSLTRNLLFLTRDAVLIDFLKDVNEEVGNILYEEDFIRKYSR